ncbi:GerMN domain-containing protein [Streptomyces sp. NPDC001857]|uniref:GerMN domain-containing protein n=1 Tax=unclassified Streptomyces TaxID=2593676 RepID=UPI00331952F5
MLWCRYDHPAALAALASCGIPTTGVIEAGRPAGGVVPRARVYFVVGETLVDVPRGTAAPVGVASAVDALLRGPTPEERAQHLTTLLPPGRTTTRTAGQDLVRVRTKGAQVTIELTRGADRLGELAAAQLICTVLAAQGVADRGAAPASATVQDAAGHDVGGTGRSCQAG